MTYWEQREKLYDRLLHLAHSSLARQYAITLNRLRTEMAALYDELNAQGTNKVLPSHLYQYDRYYKLINNITNELTLLGNKQSVVMERVLTDMYNQVCQSINKEFGLDSFFDKNQVKNVINAIWCDDGKTWSQRIWSNQTELQEVLQQGLIDNIAAGVPKDQFVANIRDSFSVSFNKADRLVRTELSYVKSKATLDRFAAAGVTKYQFLAAKDCKTCKQCKELDGKIFDIADAQIGVNIAPIHPQDRCTILAIV